MRILRILIIGSLCLLTGCAVTFTKTRFYIKTESLPMITNDSNYGQEKEVNNRIMINGNKIEYQRIYKF